MAIPLFDNQPTRRIPVMTYFLIAVNVVIFMISPMSNLTHTGDSPRQRECAQVEFSREYGAVPKELLTGDQQPIPVQDAGNCEISSFDKNPYFSGLTSMFLHGSAGHLIGNMLMLFVFGMGLEDRLGRLRFLLFYLLAGYAAVYGYALADPDSLTTLVGASGAIAGVMGAYLILNPRGRIWSLVLGFVPARLPAWVVLGFWFAYEQVLQRRENEEQNIAVMAHIAGFVFGAAYALYVRHARTTSRSTAIAGRL